MILYIHPKTGTLLKEILPLSVPALVARLPEPVLGRFHDEWSPSEVARAKIILMDVHWHMSLRSAKELAARFKRINPDVMIIVGGISATTLCRSILRDTLIDYVVRGDAEVPLALLVEAILSGSDVQGIPNIVGRDFESDRWWCLTRREMDASDYRSISWFPTLERRVLRYHRKSIARIFLPVFPYLMVFRGCPRHCAQCYGAIKPQHRLFGRGQVLRSPEALCRDLASWSEDPRYRFVTVFHDFLSFAPLSYTRQVLSRRYALRFNLALYDLPSAEAIDLVLDAFPGGNLEFSLDSNDNTSRELVDLDQLVDRIRQVQDSGRFNAAFNYVERYAASDSRYRAACERVRTETRSAGRIVDHWWEDVPMPDERGHLDDTDYPRLFARSDQHPMRRIWTRSCAQVLRYLPSVAGPLTFSLYRQAVNAVDRIVYRR